VGLITRYGTNEQKEERITVRLRENKETPDIGSFEIFALNSGVGAQSCCALSERNQTGRHKIAPLLQLKTARSQRAF
jgi:hypothetical protein